MTTATIPTNLKLALLEGLISTESGELLQQLAAQVPADLAIVEIGSFKGKSACYMASNAVAPVHCIEPWDTKGNIYGKHGFTDPSVELAFHAQVAAMGYTDKITVHKGFSHVVGGTWNTRIGMLYLDGSHEFTDVRRDYNVFAPWLAPGAIVVFDDYANRNPGVTRFVNSIKDNTNELQDWHFNVPPAAYGRKRSLRTDIKLSAAIMAHRARERHMPYLLSKLGEETPIVWDEKSDRWDTGRRSMLAYNPEATHHVVVQDDALVCEDFIAGATKALAAVPSDYPVAFYTGRVRPSRELVQRLVNKAKNAHSTWIEWDGPMWGVAVAIPTHQIQPMIEWCDRPAQHNILNYDLRMARYFMSRRIPCWYSYPSLVSHRTGDGEPSLVVGRGNSDSRVAHTFIGETASALNVEWGVDAVR